MAAGAWLCALHHYLCNDTPTAFDPLPDFSEAFYLTHNPDLAAAIGRGDMRNGYVHFLLHGAKELRSPGPTHRPALLCRTGSGAPRSGAAPGAKRVLALAAHRPRTRACAPHHRPRKTSPKAMARTLLAPARPGAAAAAGPQPAGLHLHGTTPAVSVVMVLKDDFAQTLLTLAELRGQLRRGHRADPGGCRLDRRSHATSAAMCAGRACSARYGGQPRRRA